MHSASGKALVKTGIHHVACTRGIPYHIGLDLFLLVPYFFCLDRPLSTPYPEDLPAVQKTIRSKFNHYMNQNCSIQIVDVDTSRCLMSNLVIMTSWGCDLYDSNSSRLNALGESLVNNAIAIDRQSTLIRRLGKCSLYCCMLLSTGKANKIPAVDFRRQPPHVG